MAKRNSRSAWGWSEAGFGSGWNYWETFVRTGTAPQNQGNSLDTRQRPQSPLNIFWSDNSSPLLLETSVLRAISAVTSTWFSRVLPTKSDRKTEQNSAWPGPGGHTAITTLHLPEPEESLGREVHPTGPGITAWHLHLLWPHTLWAPLNSSANIKFQSYLGILTVILAKAAWAWL